MNVPEDFQDQLEVRKLHRQAIDARTEGEYAKQEQVLKKAIESSSRLEELPLQIKERYWQADAQRLQGKYEAAFNNYKWLVGLTSNLTLDPTSNSAYPSKLIDQSSLYYLAGALIYFIECGHHLPEEFFQPERQVEALARKVDEGIGWLKQVKKSEWAAGLHLRWGLLLKEQKDLRRAHEELSEALKLAQNYPEAPGYPLVIYQLELSDLLCDLEAYAEAVPLAEKVLAIVGNGTSDRKRAYKILVYARLELGDMSIAYDPPYSKEQKLVLPTESARAITNQFIEQSRQEIDRVVDTISDPKASLVSIGGSTTPSEPTETLAYEQMRKFSDLLIKEVKRVSELTNEQVKMVNEQANKQIEKLSGNLISLSNAITDQAIRRVKLLDDENALGSDIRTVSQERNQAETEVGEKSEQSKPTKHILCAVAMPFGTEPYLYKDILFPALQMVLERPPYYWQVTCADQKTFESILQQNVVHWMERAHIYIAEISDLNPSVMMELGYMLWGASSSQNKNERERPVIMLIRGDPRENVPDKDKSVKVADLEGLLKIYYSAVRPSRDITTEEAIEKVASELDKKFEHHEKIQKLNEKKQAHYFSSIFVRKDLKQTQEVADKLSGSYETLEDLEVADVADFVEKAGLSEGTAKGLRDDILKKWRGSSQ